MQRSRQGEVVGSRWRLRGEVKNRRKGLERNIFLASFLLHVLSRMEGDPEMDFGGLCHRTQHIPQHTQHKG